MADEKVTEVEMKELTEAQDDSDKKKDKTNEEDEGDNMYSRLDFPTEETYHLVSMPLSSTKHDKDYKETGSITGCEVTMETSTEPSIGQFSARQTASCFKEIVNVLSFKDAVKGCQGSTITPTLYSNMYIKFSNFGSYGDVKVSKEEATADVYKKVRLYKRISAVFIILALILLAVAVALAMKLHEVQSVQNCPGSAVVEELNCSRNLCQTLYPSTHAFEKTRCSDYGKGWGMFENSCFFKSKERLNWQESREACQKEGGDLVVIDNERVQNFLTRNSNMLYWIGLRYSDDQQWMWINDTAPTQSFWSPSQPNPDTQGSCALINGGTPQVNNWLFNSCKVISHYICQIR